jgi:hypothetical protein
MLRSGSSSERRDHAPVHPACPATLPPRSASVPAALGKPGLRPKYGQPKAGQPKAEHAHQRCVWPTSATYISKTSTRAVHGFRHLPNNRASPRCPIRFAPANPETKMAIHHLRPGRTEAPTSPSSSETRREIASRRTKDRFHQQPVKIAGFHGPGRLPPASSPPQALPPPLVSASRVLDVLSPMAIARCGLGPRPPPRPQPRWLL